MSWARDDFEIEDPFEPSNGLEGEIGQGDVDEPSRAPGLSEPTGTGMAPTGPGNAAGGDPVSVDRSFAETSDPDSEDPAAAEVLRTLEETANFFEISMPTLRSWMQQGCPARERGGPGKPYQLSLTDVAAWRKSLQIAADNAKIARADEEAQLRMALVGEDMLPDPGGSENAKLSPAQRKEALQAELTKVKLAKERRELVMASAVQVIWARANAEVRERLRAMPDQMALRFGFPEDQADAMLEMIDDVLTDLANALSSMTEEAAS